MRHVIFVYLWAFNFPPYVVVVVGAMAMTETPLFALTHAPAPATTEVN